MFYLFLAQEVKFYLAHKTKKFQLALIFETFKRHGEFIEIKNQQIIMHKTL